MARYLIPLLLFTAILSAQQPLQFVKVLDGESGLSHSNVTALLKDKRGFLWVGTENGLNRYDGNEVRIYLHEAADELSLPDDWINSLSEDAQGFIWVGTKSGLAKLNPANGHCERYTKANGKLPGDNFGTQFFIDKRGQFWASNHSGIFSYHSKKQIFVRHPGSDSLSAGNIVADKNNIFWIGGYLGLQRFDPVSGKTNRFPHYKTIPQNNKSLSNSKIKTDSYGNIWVLSWGGGVYRFLPETSRFEQYTWVADPEFPEYFNIAKDIAECYDENGNRTLWIATEAGLMQMWLSPEESPSSTTKFTYYKEPGSNILLVDGNTLWAGGIFGLYKTNLRTPAVTNFAVLPSPIQQFSKTLKGDILVCATNPALTIFDARGYKKQEYHALPPGSKDEMNSICWAVTEDTATGILYAGTFNGMTAVNTQTGQTRWYQPLPGDTTGIYAARVVRLMSLGENRLLVIGWYAKPQIIDTRTGKNIRSLWPHPIICEKLKCDQTGRIWLCGDNRILEFDKTKQEMRLVLEVNDISIRFSDLLVDSKGRCWVASDRGFWQIDPATNKVIRYFKRKDGLLSDLIYSMAEDLSGRIWLSTSMGVCLYYPEKNSFQTLAINDGLLDWKEINYLTASPDGKMWFVQMNKLSYLNTASVIAAPPSKCLITGLKVNEKEWITDRFFEPSEKIVLSPGQNALVFSFSAFDLVTPGRTNYLYRLDGLQKNWTKAGKTKKASFVNLPAGTYTFRVRPEDAGESDAWDAVLCVVVTDYFWQRLWFKITTVILLTAVITALFFIARTRQLSLKTERLKAEKEIETAQKDANRSTLAALRAFINPHFLFNVLNAVQASILRKTPLEASSALGKFADLMRRTLEHAQKETAPLAEELELLQLYLESQQLRFENAFDFSISAGKGVDTDDDFIPTMILQPFVENAIEHGLLLKKDGKGFLKIQVEKTGDQLCCLIEDNGIGRAKAAEMAAGKRHPKTSQGTRITEERLRLLSGNNRVEIEDLYAEDGQAAGTRVRVWVE
jgi:ligand-binding sensor domain-containing protein/two-component sensor histidine kinase